MSVIFHSQDEDDSSLESDLQTSPHDEAVPRGYASPHENPPPHSGLPPPEPYPASLHTHSNVVELQPTASMEPASPIQAPTKADDHFYFTIALTVISQFICFNPLPRPIPHLCITGKLITYDHCMDLEPLKEKTHASSYSCIVLLVIIRGEGRGRRYCFIGGSTVIVSPASLSVAL